MLHRRETMATAIAVLLSQWPMEVRALCPEHLRSFLPIRADNPVAVSVETGNDVVGQWLEAEPWPTIAIHAALLPTGEVLHYSYPNGGAGTDATVWNPTTGQFTDVEGFTDLFCSGHSQLPNGMIYVAGGNAYECPFQGRNTTFTFNPYLKSWTQLGNMTVGRWYPTNIVLGDGRTIITSGLDQTCFLTDVMEQYTPGIGLQTVPSGNRFMQLYPRMHLLSDGRIVHVGVESEVFAFNPQTAQWNFVNNSGGGYRWNGSSVLVPGETDEVMILGGQVNGVASSSARRCDFSQPNPTWQTTAPMHFGRGHPNVVILPDKTVLVVGGGLLDLYNDPVLNAELYDPATDAWTLLPAQQYGRMYHSTALLLPDGRVISAGQDNGNSAFRGEVYEPAYLFRGGRPEIRSVTDRVTYGQRFIIRTTDAQSIQSVALIGLGSVTHSVNMNQRYVGLTFTAQGDERIRATAPATGNHAPPGYYMLFIVDDDGVPSVASMVQLSLADEGIPCLSVRRFAARCIPNDRIRVTLTLFNSYHDGETVTVDVGGTPVSMPIQGRRGRLTVDHPGGEVWITLIDPEGCAHPRLLQCD